MHPENMILSEINRTHELKYCHLSKAKFTLKSHKEAQEETESDRLPMTKRPREHGQRGRKKGRGMIGRKTCHVQESES